MSVKCLIYCTKAKPYLYHEGTEKWWFNEGVLEPFAYIEGYDLYKEKQKEMSNIDSGDVRKTIYKCLNGKIVAQFDCEKVEEIFYNGWWECYANDPNDINCLRFFNEFACLTTTQIKNYIGYEKGYAIHISNLEIFDKPKELYEYDIKLTPQKLVNPISKDSIVISNITYSCTKAPMNICNVYDRFRNHYVLISIRPEYVAKILNGEKIIEVRRKILNCLKDLI